MTKDNAVESPEDVLAKARTAGHSVNEDQLPRWHRCGLLPRPQQRWTVGVAGSQTVYPIGTGDQLRALCTVRQENRSSVMNWGWRLWWLGFPVHEKYWRLRLKAQALHLDKCSRKLILMLDGDNAQYGDSVTGLRIGRTRNVSFRQLRRRLSAGRFEDMLGLIRQILEHEFRGWSSASADDVDAIRDRMMIERVFGFRRAKNAKAMVHDPAMHNDIESALHLLSDQLGKSSMASLLKATSDGQIAEARTQLRAILFTVAGISENSSLLAGYGVSVLKELARRITTGDQATLVLYLLALKRSPIFQKNLAIFLHALRRHVPKSISDEQIEYLRGRDPAICAFAFPE